MPLDGLYVHKLIREIKSNSQNMNIKNIYQPVNDQILFQLTHGNILFSLENPCYMIYLDKKPDVPEKPGNFSLFLRKKIKSGKIKDIIQLSIDRTGYFEIESFDEIGNLRNFRLYFELMGRNSNLILVNEDNKIEDAFKKSNTDTRTIFPGAIFRPFYDSDKKNILETPFSEEDLQNKNLCGFSKTSYDILSEKGREKCISDLQNNFVYYTDSNGKYDILALDPQSSDSEILTPSAGIIKLFSEKSNMARFSDIKKRLEKNILKHIEKYEKQRDYLMQDISQKDTLDTLIKNGEILKANIYKVKKGDKKVVFEDWYTGDNVEIELDELKTPAKNLELIFKNIKKIKTRVTISQQRLKETSDFLEYLYQLWAGIDISETVEDLKQINEEMISENLIKNSGNKKIKKVKNTYRIFDYENYEIIVGKNNTQNDEITKNAAKDDIWLHTKGIPGSHVIVKRKNEDIPEIVLKYAASLAATYSRAKMSYNVSVDYTERKNVWKPKGAKPGMVLYKNFSTLTANPIR